MVFQWLHGNWRTFCWKLKKSVKPFCDLVAFVHVMIDFEAKYYHKIKNPLMTTHRNKLIMLDNLHYENKLLTAQPLKNLSRIGWPIAYSHCTRQGVGQGIWDWEQWVTNCASPVSCTCAVPVPVQCECAISRNFGYFRQGVPESQTENMWHRVRMLCGKFLPDATGFLRYWTKKSGSISCDPRSTLSQHWNTKHSLLNNWNQLESLFWK